MLWNENSGRVGCWVNEDFSQNSTWPWEWYAYKSLFAHHCDVYCGRPSGPLRDCQSRVRVGEQQPFSLPIVPGTYFVRCLSVTRDWPTGFFPEGAGGRRAYWGQRERERELGRGAEWEGMECAGTERGEQLHLPGERLSCENKKPFSF